MPQNIWSSLHNTVWCGTFEGSRVLYLFAKVFSTKFGGCGVFWWHHAAKKILLSTKFSPAKVSRYTVVAIAQVSGNLNTNKLDYRSKTNDFLSRGFNDVCYTVTL